MSLDVGSKEDKHCRDTTYNLQRILANPLGEGCNAKVWTASREECKYGNIHCILLKVVWWKNVEMCI